MISGAFSLVKRQSCGDDLDVRIERRRMRSRAASNFWPADVARPVKNLALQIRNIDSIGIDQTERADSRRREIERGRRTEPARADAQDARRFDAALPSALHLGQEKMPRVTREILAAQRDLRKSLLVDDALAHVFKIAPESNRFRRFARPRNASAISGRPDSARLSFAETRLRRNPFRSRSA